MNVYILVRHSHDSYVRTYLSNISFEDATHEYSKYEKGLGIFLDYNILEGQSHLDRVYNAVHLIIKDMIGNPFDIHLRFISE